MLLFVIATRAGIELRKDGEGFPCHRTTQGNKNFKRPFWLKRGQVAEKGSGYVLDDIVLNSLQSLPEVRVFVLALP